MKAKVDRLAEMMKNMIEYCDEEFDAGLAEISNTVDETLLRVWRENSSLPCDCFYNLTIIKGETDMEYLSCDKEKCDNCGDCCGECLKNGREDDSETEWETDSDSDDDTGRCLACGEKGRVVGDNCDCVECAECDKRLTYAEFDRRGDWEWDEEWGHHLCVECK